jgi:hypothetical protein
MAEAWLAAARSGEWEEAFAGLPRHSGKLSEITHGLTCIINEP